MTLDSVVEARIHPSIGVARIGNSDQFFLGPEVPTTPTLRRVAIAMPPDGSSARQRVFGSMGMTLPETWLLN